MVKYVKHAVHQLSNLLCEDDFCAPNWRFIPWLSHVSTFPLPSVSTSLASRLQTVEKFKPTNYDICPSRVFRDFWTNATIFHPKFLIFVEILQSGLKWHHSSASLEYCWCESFIVRLVNRETLISCLLVSVVTHWVCSAHIWLTACFPSAFWNSFFGLRRSTGIHFRPRPVWVHIVLPITADHAHSHLPQV